MKNRVRVRDFDKLFRDNRSRAIVNSDSSGYQARVRRKAARSYELEEIARLTNELRD